MSAPQHKHSKQRSAILWLNRVADGQIPTSSAPNDVNVFSLLLDLLPAASLACMLTASESVSLPRPTLFTQSFCHKGCNAQTHACPFPPNTPPSAAARLSQHPPVRHRPFAPHSWLLDVQRLLPGGMAATMRPATMLQLLSTPLSSPLQQQLLTQLLLHVTSQPLPLSQLSALLTGIHSARLASPPAALLAAISDSCALVLESAVASAAAAAGAVAGASDEQHPAAVGGDSLVVAQQAAVLPLLLQRLGCRVSQRVCGLVCSVTGPCLPALSGAELADLSLGLALAGHQPGQE